jgi:diguanylate cyclase (GGDEF)-like protein
MSQSLKSRWRLREDITGAVHLHHAPSRRKACRSQCPAPPAPAVETRVDNLPILEQENQAEPACLYEDTLTGAFNRHYFEAELHRQFRRACRRGTILGLLFLHLDDFKRLGDDFGPHLGERILRETADRLFAAVRHGDIVVRYAAEEFCVLVENTSPAGLRAMADRLGQDLNRRTLREQEQAIVVQAWIGAVLCLPRTYAGSAADFLRAADQALDTARATGGEPVTLVSLLEPAEVETLRAVESRMFSLWLAERGVWKPRHLGLGVRRAGARFAALGRLACRLGWLSTAQRAALLRRQRATRRPFHAIAREQGDLTSDQLHALLALQLEPPEDLAAHLINQGIADEPDMRGYLRQYYRGLAAAGE